MAMTPEEARRRNREKVKRFYERHPDRYWAAREKARLRIKAPQSSAPR